ncbi:MAG: hypothetical protein VR72_17820 [Clostridiaceae bacterium BRH_c20a]|nr:MAG: hypothetical protein VR72_17820 [Clostridiaceae bacterium BRH_c20a]
MNNNTDTNKLIVELTDLNKKLNSMNEESNVKLVLANIKDERDAIIDKILFDKEYEEKEYVYDFYQKQITNMTQYYRIHENNNIDFTYIVEKIIRVLMKNFWLASYIKSPKGYLIHYLFLYKINFFPNRIWAIAHKYFQKFDETKTHIPLHMIRENATKLDKSEQDYFTSNKSNFDMEYHSSMIDECIRQSEEINYMDLLDSLDEEDRAWHNEEDVIEVSIESKPLTDNNIIRTFDINYEQFMMRNNLLTTEECNQKLNRIRKIKLGKWKVYCDNTGLLPSDITKYTYNEENEGYNYIPHRERVKYPEYIEVLCRPKKFDFTAKFFDKRAETYIKSIIRKLSKRNQLLTGLLYYQMIPIDEIVKILNFVNRDSLNKEKSRILIILKNQILKDYEYIMTTYSGTYLCYWTKKIKQKADRNAKKVKKVLSI